MTKISVIIPVFNAEKYLVQCIESILSQSLKEIEIICINDCSKDASIEILNEYQRKYDNITVLNNEVNLGAGLCRNKGLSIARGEYIHFLDADDFIEKESYEPLYRIAKINNLDILKFKAYDFDTNTGIRKESSYNALLKIPKKCFNVTLDFFSNPNIFTQICVAPWASLFNRNFLIDRNIKFNDLRCVNDRSFYSEAVFKAKRIMLTDIHIVNYRTNNANSLVGNRGKYFECHFDSYNLIYKLSDRLPYNIRKNYMENELHDIAFWLEKYVQSDFAPEINGKLDTFLTSLDKSLWNNDILGCTWYKKIMKSKILIENRIPKISVITPVFNSSTYLRECILSLINQTFKEVEFIFVDDGSTDNSLEILEEYQKVDSRIIILKQENSFAGVARNNGISIARGKYITFLDSDDIMVDYALEKLYAKAESTKADIVFSKAYHFSKSINDKKIAGWILRENYLPKEEVFCAKDCGKVIYQISAGVVWGKLFKVDFIKANRLEFPATPCSEDFYFAFLAYALAERISVLHKPTVFYRNMSNSSSLEHTKDKYPGIYMDVRKLLWEKLNDLGVYKNVEQSFVNSFVLGIFNNIKQCQTSKSFDITYRKFKESVDLYRIDFQNYSYFYFINAYEFAKAMNDSTNSFDFLFSIYANKLSNNFRDNYTKEKKGSKSIRSEFKKVVYYYKYHGLLQTLKKVFAELRFGKTKTTKNYKYYKTLKQSDYEEELKQWYYRNTNKKLDLNNPKTFNEKIQWLKLNDSTPLKTKLADKFLVRDWVRDKIGEEYLIPLLGVYDSFDDIDFSNMPDKFVLKTNHGCKWMALVDDKSKFNIQEAKKKFDVWMKKNFAFVNGFELQYLDIPPKIVAEEYLLNGDDQLVDYKVYCFNGKAKSIQYFQDRDLGLRETFFDLDWNNLHQTTGHKLLDKEVDKPSNLDHLIKLAEKLSEGFSFVRVDFYILNDGTIKFGELTFTPRSGVCDWQPNEVDKIYGDLITLPAKSPLPKKYSNINS